MRKVFYIGMLVLLLAACHSGNNKPQQSQETVDALQNERVDFVQGPAAIKFDTIYFDLGSLDINCPDQSRDFIFANVGGEPLVIDSVEASCPCLDIAYPHDSIAQGHKSKITLTLKMKEISSGQFYRNAFVYTNGSDEPTEIVLQGIKNYE